MSIVQQGNISYPNDLEDLGLERFPFYDIPKYRMNITNMTWFFPFSHDLGTIQVTKSPITWAIGYTTDPAISYANKSTTSSQERRPYYKSQYADDESLVTLSIFEQVLVLIYICRSLTF